MSAESWRNLDERRNKAPYGGGLANHRGISSKGAGADLGGDSGDELQRQRGRKASSSVADVGDV